MLKTRTIPAIFLLLVAATVGAFFITQRLKRAKPVVERVFYQRYLSPNGDGRKDTVPMRFDLPETEEVTVSVVNDDGDSVKDLADDARLAKGTHSYLWDGRNESGDRAPDGRYRLRVNVRSEGRSLTASRQLELDTKPPAPQLVSAGPRTIVPGLPGKRGRARIRYKGPSDPAPQFIVYRTDAAGGAREATRFAGPRFRKIAFWNGRVRGAPAPAGTYAFGVTAQDKAGNVGSAPAKLPPAPRTAKPGTGVSVRYLTVRGPTEPVKARGIARFQVGPVQRRYRWSLERLGSPTPERRGSAAHRALAVRIPSDARGGIYVLRVLSAGRRAAVPVAVESPARENVLVVLPTITWQGTNPWDDDGSGFPDTLAIADTARIERPFAPAGLPGGFDRGVAPLVRFLDRRFKFDLTTDVALARRHGPKLEGRTGVLFPGSERWLTDSLDLRLRRFVEGGGTVASFGTDAFRRTVDVGADELSGPSTPDRLNVFGEATSFFGTEPAPLDVSLDRARIFTRTDGIVGRFGRYERSDRLAPPNKVLTEAGRDERTAFVAYRRERGLVIRAGTPQWAGEISASKDVAAVTGRIWNLLAR